VRAADQSAQSQDVFATGTFPICPETHDQGLRWLFDVAAVLLLLDCRPGDTVLDLGAGPGFSSEMMARLGYRVVPVDPDRAALVNNRRRPSFDSTRIAGVVAPVSAIAESLPFADRSFDGAIGLNVLHHIADLSAALAELRRVLRPGARAAFCEPGLDHLQSPEAQRAIREHGENDRPFDVLAFLRLARSSGFREAMLSATLQSPLRLLPVEEVDEFLTGQHHRPHMTARGVLEELHRRHAFGMIVREGRKPLTSRNPGILARRITVSGWRGEVRRGVVAQFHVRAHNTGDSLWLAGRVPFGGFVTIGCKLLFPDHRLIDDALGRTFLDHDVKPGDAADVRVALAFPGELKSGKYLLEVDCVNEMVSWFGDGQPDDRCVLPLELL
jgi:SAM-dependent methyltransferase